MSGTAWVNGKFIDQSIPCLRIQDRGFLYGDGLFETMRLHEGQVLCCDQHLARLSAGCAALKINFPLEEVTSGVEETAAELKNGVLRLTLSRGESARGLLPPLECKATVVVTGSTGEPYPEDAYKKGFRTCLISFPRSHLSPLVQLKSLNCLENILGRQEVAAAGVEEGLFCNYLGEIAEGTTSNVFLVMEGRLITPPPECGLLPGIMRAQVISLASRQGITITEEKLYPEDFSGAEEAFLTNSLLGIMPLVSFEGKPVGDGCPGPLTELLRSKI